MEDMHPARYPVEFYGQNYFSYCYSVGCIALSRYLASDEVAARRWGMVLMKEVQEYLCGEWRAQDSYWAMGGGEWMTLYRTAVAFAMSTDSIAIARRLSTFPPSAKGDPSTWANDASWYVLLASYMIDPESREIGDRVATMAQRGPKGHRILAAMLKAICDKDVVRAQEALGEHIAYYLRYHRSRDEIDYQLALDASILWKLAECSGITLEADERTKDSMLLL